MNPIIKASIAGALTLGAVSAHAALAVPTTSNPGDLILFAEVLNSSNAVIGSFAGDTGVKVTAVASAISGGVTKLGGDSNLASLISLGTQSGNSIVWGVQGGGQLSALDYELGDPGAAQFYTTATANGYTNIIGQPTGVLDTWANLGNTLATVNTHLAHSGDLSVFGSSTAAAGIWDSTAISNNPQNWYGGGGNTGNTGLNTADALYGVTGGATKVAVSQTGVVTLSASGLTFGTASAPVPLPAAIWLLGSGLLGLAGVGRRKAAA
jgi:hypothetical protein